MKILAISKPTPTTSMDKMTPHLLDEARHAWSLYMAGTVREMYMSVDRSRAVIVFEAASVEEVERIVAEFPLARAGQLAFDLIPLAPFFPIESLFAKP